MHRPRPRGAGVGIPEVSSRQNSKPFIHPKPSPGRRSNLPSRAGGDPSLLRQMRRYGDTEIRRYGDTESRISGEVKLGDLGDYFKPLISPPSCPPPSLPPLPSSLPHHFAPPAAPLQIARFNDSVTAALASFVIDAARKVSAVQCTRARAQRRP